jgi:AhpD family alkylhydroperoxidase
VPNSFATMAHRPDILNKFIPLYGAILEGGTVEPRYKELAYLKTSLINGCEYWARAHTASAKRIGIIDDQIHALQFYRRSPLFDEKEKANILFAARVTRGAAGIRRGTLEELRKYYDVGQIVELALVICTANFSNRFNDAMENVPDLGV